MSDAAFNDAEFRLKHGSRFPYDAPDGWWREDGTQEPLGGDWAVVAARAVLADLCDRRGVKQGLYDIDYEVRAEMVQSLADIIRLAAPA